MSIKLIVLALFQKSIFSIEHYLLSKKEFHEYSNTLRFTKSHLTMYECVKIIIYGI